MGADIFPYQGEVTELTQTDFYLFDLQFKDILKQLIPTSQQVTFFSKKQLAAPLSPNADSYIREISQKSNLGQKATRIDERSLLLPLREIGDNGSVAIVSGIDPVIVSKSADEWLAQLEGEAIEEFLHLRHFFTDSSSGLYNTRLLNQFLHSGVTPADSHLLTIELFGSFRTAKDAFSHIEQTVTNLHDFNRNGFPLFHLGNGVFALLALQVKHENVNKMCSALINFFKNRNYRRAHCGFSSFGQTTEDQSPDSMSGQMKTLQEAFKALHISCKRGPFAFCDYDLIANPARSKLDPEDRSTISRLQYRWRSLHSFNLILIKPAYRSVEEVKGALARALDGENVVFGKHGAYIIRSDEALNQSLRWARDLVKSLAESAAFPVMVSGGVSTYPYMKMSKSDSALNSLKATIHASFFGVGNCVVFDEVSQNIAGDIYFEEGDFNRAIKQYRLGLEINAVDPNLLNSLGVSYALMNKKKRAQQTFDLVLKRDPANIMALYNRALGLFVDSQYREALCIFKRIGPLLEQDKDSLIKSDELDYFVGICTFHNGSYKIARSLLVNSYDSKSALIEKGRCSRSVGVCFYHENKLESAATWLQRALSHDKNDALSLSLLGDIYIRTDQGYLIGLRLLEKSIEIAGDLSDYLFRYGQGLSSGGLYTEAIAAFSRCLRSSKQKNQVYIDLSFAYSQVKNIKKAQFYLAKVDPKVRNSKESKEKIRRINIFLKKG